MIYPTQVTNLQNKDNTHYVLDAQLNGATVTAHLGHLTELFWSNYTCTDVEYSTTLGHNRFPLSWLVFGFFQLTCYVRGYNN